MLLEAILEKWLPHIGAFCCLVLMTVLMGYCCRRSLLCTANAHSGLDSTCATFSLLIRPFDGQI